MGLLSAVSGLLRPAPPADPAVRAALQRVDALVDPLLKTTPGFDRHLAAPVHHALGYCEGLVAGLPGPLAVDRRAFAADPLIHALFPTPDDIPLMLGRSQAVRDYLASAESWEADHFYALLAARREEKRQFGLALQGDVVHDGVPQTILYFSDHTLVEPRPALAATLAGLRRSAFDSLLQSFKCHVEALRLEREAVRGDTSVERAHLTVLRGRTPGPEYAIHTRRLAELDAHLRAVAESLQPEHLARALAAFLLSPEMSLRLEPVSVRVDRLGVVVAADQAGAGETLHFPELTGRDRRLYLVMLCRIDRAEAQAAVDAVMDRQRRFLLI